MRSTVVLKDNFITSKFNLPDGTYNITISKQCDDHTIDQVRKLWATIDDISVKIYGNKSESENIYLQILKMAGQRTTKVYVEEEAIPLLKKTVKCLSIISRDVVNHKAMAVCDCCMVGISEMDKRELSNVIEACIKYASEYGIDTELERTKYETYN